MVGTYTESPKQRHCQKEQWKNNERDESAIPSSIIFGNQITTHHSLHFRVRRTLRGFASPQLLSIPCSNSVFNSAAVCICKFGSSTVTGVLNESAIARLAASNPCLNKS